MKRSYFDGPVGDAVGLVAIEPALGQEAAAERAVGEQPCAVALADSGELAGGAAVEQREGHLVGASGMPSDKRQGEVRGVEIGDADRADQALLAQARHLVQRIEPGRMLERPPVELQQVDAFDAEPVEPLLDARAHDLRRSSGRAPGTIW